MSHGLVIGKFYPPHAGHHHLIDTAAARCDRLTVVVAASPVETIPIALRAAWLRERHPQPHVEIVAAVDDNEVDYDSDEVWAAHVAVFRAAAADPVDTVFSSEEYGPELARRLDAVHVPVDPARTRHPVSGTAVRADPVACWEWLSPAVRAYLARRVVVVGAESSGTHIQHPRGPAMTSGNTVYRAVRVGAGKVTHATAAAHDDLNARTVCGRLVTSEARSGAPVTCARCKRVAAPSERRRAVSANIARDAVTVRVPARNVDGMSWGDLRIASYLRLSRDDDDSASIAHQDATTDRTAKAHGGTVAARYTDDGLSGTLPLEDRPDMARLVADIRAGKWDLVISRKSDRYARDEYQMRRLANVCRVADVALWSVEEGSLTDEDGQLNMAAITASFVNAIYTKDGSKKARDSKAQMRTQGRWTSGRAPFGYRVVPATVNGVHGKYLAEDTEYADRIRDAITRVLNGTRVRTIVDEWNAEGVLSRDERQRELYGRPAIGKHGKTQWDASTFRDMLTSPRLLGLMLWDDTPARHKTDENGKRRKVKSRDMKVFYGADGRPVTVTVDGKGIIDEQTLSLVRHELLVTRAVETSGYETRTLLRGIAKCGTCGSNLVRNAQKNGRAGGHTYRCTNRACAKRVNISGPALEKYVESEFLAVWGDVTLWHTAESGEGEAVRAALRDAETRMATLAERMADAAIHPAALDALTANLNRVAAEVAALRERAEAEPTVTTVYDDKTLGERWADGDTDVRRALLRDLGIVANVGVGQGRGRWSRPEDRVKVRATSELAGHVLSALSTADDGPDSPDADAAREATGVRGVHIRI
ncbi:recombinase family protein [Actinoallomurus iriomotensis]|uniref:recombinase family protein n=1 Tax=Actinoallomurus iriomotensis TaxID=478107 RepID=UPI0025558F9A|nr:recombinase family protein [Actinoallomurus iriomotensis]